MKVTLIDSDGNAVDLSKPIPAGQYYLEIIQGYNCQYSGCGYVVWSEHVTDALDHRDVFGHLPVRETGMSNE